MSAVPGADLPMDMPKPKKKRERKGRVGTDKQEAVITLSWVSDREEDLVKLYHEQETAATDFNEAIKATAEKAGLNASAVRKFIIAKAGEHYDDVKKNVTQLSLLFDLE